MPADNLLFQSLVGAKQQLLPGLPARVKRARYLHAAKGACVQQPAVFPREGNALRNALVDIDVGQRRRFRRVGRRSLRVREKSPPFTVS